MSLKQFCERKDNSWVRDLNVDPEWEDNKPNKISREVKSGHYVFVKPTPLPDPVLVSLSSALLEELELDENECETDNRFIKYFSGDGEAFKDEGFDVSWATPYALSIYGSDYYQNCPFGNGNGYGDGRAISVGEVLLPNDKRWEFQLKGSGTTPFCRGGDGRAVLRSSVREFIASEAMHNLGVSTTRAMSLITSQTETVKRPWYKELSPKERQKLHDTLVQVPTPFREMYKQRLSEPNVLAKEKTAITCRVSPSFTRVGHIQLFERRARADESKVDELRMIVKHVIKREYTEIYNQDSSFQEKVLSMLKEASERFGKLTADWIRVGYCQGNFNSDNCLVSGRTMDYGPFGFIEKFTPLWNMWVGGGDHFGFLNQDDAGHKNFISLVKAVEPLLDEEGVTEAESIAERYVFVAQRALQRVWKQKLGLTIWNEDVSILLNSVFELLETVAADYTLFWRQLSFIPIVAEKNLSNEELLSILGDIYYYSPLPSCYHKRVTDWLRSYIKLILEESKQFPERSFEQISIDMKKVSPKYVPREWILVKAYSAAYDGNFDIVNELYQLFLHPYDELSNEFEEKYYKKAPSEVYDGIVGVGGTSFMTCSS